MKKILIVILLLLLVINFSYRIDLKKTPHELIGELMYFPSGIALRIVCMGYYGPLADMVWLRFIQYYGEHRMTDIRFDMMYHILDILTTLDSHFLYAYTLGGLMLTHDAQRPDQARDLLKKGMHSNPEDWRLPFIYGFIHYVFLSEYRIAQTYFRIAAQKPNAPATPQRWAAFTTYVKLGDLNTGLALWSDLYNTTQNPEEKAIALFYIKKITMLIHIRMLNEKIEDFHDQFRQYPHTLKQLVKHGLLDSIPSEPHGENYRLRGHKAFSTWDPYKSE
jgi:hypothetical protein